MNALTDTIRYGLYAIPVNRTNKRGPVPILFVRTFTSKPTLKDVIALEHSPKSDELKLSIPFKVM